MTSRGTLAVPVLIRAGRRWVPRRRRRPPLVRPPAPLPEIEEGASIALLSAANFLAGTREKGTLTAVMPMSEFLRVTDAARAVPAEAPTRERSVEDLIEDVPAEVLRAILRADPVEVDAVPPGLRPFQSWVSDSPWLGRVSDEDIDKYLQGKPPPTKSEILQKLPPEYHDLWEVFEPSGAETLPPHRPFDHKIDLMPGAKPPSSHNRAFSPKELLVIRKYLDDHLAKGFIRSSNSPAASPLLLAKKPGGGVRVCVDYRGLNNITVKNRYPIPLIRETLDALVRAKYFTKLDIVAAFNRLRIAPGDEWKTAFITRFGLFECLVAGFGLTGTPSSWQHFMNHTFFDVLDKYVTAYLDDILIWSASKKDHRRHVREVLTRLQSVGLTADIRKCEFSVTETKYLGLIITTKGIRMDPEKVEAVTSWPEPRTVKQLQSFLGFSNFYRRFIEGYSKIARPLTDLLKGKTWSGDLPDAARAAFAELKAAFTTAPVLNYFDPARRTVVETDASDWASGGVLSQYDEEGVLHPVSFFSAKHSPAECNYEIYDKELLAIIKAFEEWRPELQGVDGDTEVITDHKNLEHFTTTKLLNQRQVRWSEFLSDFRFRIAYRPGRKAAVPDALSRLPGSAPPDKTNTADSRIANRERVLLPPDRWAVSLSVLHASD